MKGYKTELTTAPSLIYYQISTTNIFNIENPLLISFYKGSVNIVQGKNSINIDNDYLEDFLKTIKEGRNESFKYLK